MRRLSIDVTPEQHQRLKAIAALSGMTIKEYVLERCYRPSRSWTTCPRKTPYTSWKPC